MYEYKPKHARPGTDPAELEPIFRGLADLITEITEEEK